MLLLEVGNYDVTIKVLVGIKWNVNTIETVVERLTAHELNFTCYLPPPWTYCLL